MQPGGEEGRKIGLRSAGGEGGVEAGCSPTGEEGLVKAMLTTERVLATQGKHDLGIRRCGEVEEAERAALHTTATTDEL